MMKVNADDIEMNEGPTQAEWDMNSPRHDNDTGAMVAISYQFIRREKIQ